MNYLSWILKQRFFFIVNGKIYHTNSLVANLISPIISKNYKEKNEQQSIQTSRMRFQLIGKLFQFSSRSVIKIYTSATIFECFLNHLRKTLKYFWLYYLHNSYCTIIYIYIYLQRYIYTFFDPKTHIEVWPNIHIFKQPTNTFLSVYILFEKNILSLSNVNWQSDSELNLSLSWEY